MVPTIPQLERNLRFYPWCIAAFGAYCWLPVFFLFFSDKLPIERVLLLEAIYFAAICLMEVPSGYFADRVGRRTTLLISAVTIVASHGVFFMGSYSDDVFAPYCVAQVLLAIGLAFRNGTDTAFHYDTLQALGRGDEYGPREATAGRSGFLSNATAALIGGAAASIELRYAYLLSLLAGLVLLAIVVSFVEPGGLERTQTREQSFTRQLGACIQQLQNPTLRWLFGFTVFMVIVNHVPYEFYQPYLSALTSGSGMLDRSTALASGAHTFVAMLVASWVAARSIRVRDRIGVGPTLLAAALLQVATIAIMGFALHLAVAVLLLARSCPRALMTAPMNAEITPRLPQGLRATYLSVQSLMGRFAFSGLLVALPLAVEANRGGQADEWTAVSSMLKLCAIVGGAGLLALLLTSGVLRKHDGMAGQPAIAPAEE